LVELKLEIRRRRSAPTLEALSNALKEFLHRAGEPSEARVMPAFDFHSAVLPHSRSGTATLRLMVGRYNKIVRFIDRELSIEWPTESVATPSVNRSAWSTADLVGESDAWTPKRVQRAIDCVARALILQRSVQVPRKD